MKYIIPILFLVFSSQSFATHYFQVGAGSITPHFSSSKKNYCNQWNNTGIIVNKTYYIRYLTERFGITYMQGNDSICSPIEGIFVHYIFTREKWWEMGVIAGGYAYEQNNWDEHAEKTPSGIDAPAPVRTEFGGRDIVPVIALDVAIHLIRSKNWSLKLNNFFTPVIFNHSLAVEWRF